MTVARLQRLVRSGQLRYVLAGVGRAGFGGRGPFAAPPGADGGSQLVTAWVTQNCVAVTISGSPSSVYDCAAAAGGSAS